MFDINSDIVPILMENEYLVVVQGNKQAIVTGILTDQNITVFGRTPNWILTKRIIDKFNTSEITSLESINAQSLCRWIIEQTFTCDETLGTDNDNLKCGEVLSDDLFTEMSEGYEKTSPDTVSNVITELLNTEGAGHEVHYDVKNKCWTFNILIGEEKNNILLSKGNKNAYDISYKLDILNRFTSGYYEENITVEDETTQTETNETVLNYVEGDKHGIYKWDTFLGSVTKSEAETTLKEYAPTKEIGFKTRNLQFNADYNLGDIFRVQTELGKFKTTLKQRVIEINLVYEPNNISEEPIFENYEEVSENGI